jgi:type II secretory ATPase GspE/PulE/Tfp pilus assembly ATPase PilB-like protein
MMTETITENTGLERSGQIAELEEILLYQKALHGITNLLESSSDIKQMFTSTKQAVLDLFSVQVFRLYVFDPARNEIYSVVNPGEWASSIRLPVSNSSIQGFVAKSGRMVNIADAYDAEELKSIDPEIKHNAAADRKSGVRLREVMMTAAVCNDELLGIVEIANRREGEGMFVDEEPVLLQEIADTMAVSLYNVQKKKRRTKFDYLVAGDMINRTDLENSWVESRKSGLTMEEYLMRTFRIPRNEIGKALEEFYDCKFVQFAETAEPPEGLLKNLKPEYLRRELWVPLKKTDNGAVVLMDDPQNILKKDQIENFLKTKNIEICVALKEDILKYIGSFYRKASAEESVSELLGKMDPLMMEEDEEEEEAIAESDSVIMQLVNKIIYDGYTSRASDIHIEPNAKKKTLEVRFRIDGDCVKYQSLPYSYRAAAVSRIKIMSNLDITERRLPQDGKIKFRKGGSDLELRVATIPTQGNVEDVVMRILAKGETMGLGHMAMAEDNLDNFKRILDKPYGIILVVGPTGSGKTTTLHAALQYLNTPGTKIWTAEDPVEITQEGLRQVQVNPKIGFDFSNAMRSFLRADPDVIMVGEMRDYETAKIGVEASLTGHLVLSTLHTNSAPETIIRLLDMGIDPFNFADSLLGVLAQRLVRVLCPKCKEAYEPEPDVVNEIISGYGSDVFTELGGAKTLFRPRGCSECNNTGYKGRIGIHELLVTNDAMKLLVAKHASVEELRTEAVKAGMRTLLQDGIRKVLEGKTDLKQVLAVCMR